LRKALKAPPGNEKAIIETELAQPAQPNSKPLPFKSTVKRLSLWMEKAPKRTFKVNSADLYALLITLNGKNVDPETLDRARQAFPVLWDDEIGD